MGEDGHGVSHVHGGDCPDVSLSDARVTALVELTERVETEVRAAMGTDTLPERDCLVAAFRNLRAARISLDRLSALRLKRQVACRV
jgi:hypothetical protein